MQKDFKCQNCHYSVKTEGDIGTKNRNHCPQCLYSKHVDKLMAGDRESSCMALMEPIGLTFKKSAPDKYGKQRQGELMLIHQCKNKSCEKISINRIAADDDNQVILNVFEESLKNKKHNLQGIVFLNEEDREEVTRQLFGK